MIEVVINGGVAGGRLIPAERAEEMRINHESCQTREMRTWG